jgi:hypothetical protein
MLIRVLLDLLLRFVTFRLKDSDKNMRQINPFYVQKALDSIAGKVKNASRLKDGTALTEVHNDKQAELLLKATLLGSHPIYAERHSSLNSSDALDGMSNDLVRTRRAVRLKGLPSNWKTGWEAFPSQNHLFNFRGSFLVEPHHSRVRKGLRPPIYT